MIPFIGRLLHEDLVVRHWNTVVNIVETFLNGLCRKPNPFLKYGGHFWQLRHSIRGGVTLKAHQKGRMCSWQPSDNLPHVYKQHSPAFESDSTFLLQRSVTHQDDVESDDRTQLI